MKILLLLAGILSFLMFFYSVIKGIVKRDFKRVAISFLALGILLIILLFASRHVIDKTTAKARQISENIKSHLRPRSGFEIYVALFGKPTDTPVVVLRQKDPIVPRLDCCIWLEFKLSPTELKRIISTGTYSTGKYASKESALYMPSFSPMPSWWTPGLFNDSLIVLEDMTNSPNRERIMIFSSDSSHVFYCDMAD